MKPTHVEMEMKLIAPDPAALRALPAALKETCDRLRDDGAIRIVDTYYDTPRWDLRAAGYACRLRRAGRKAVLCLKSLKRPRRGVSIREEFEQRIPAPPARGLPRPLPGRLGRKIDTLTGDAPLREIFRIRNNRRLFHARFNGLSAIVCADRFTVSARGNARPFAEVELELIAGTARDLRKFGRLLMQQVPLRSGTRSKFRLGLRAGRHPLALPPR
jgi:inorganic triphosphatase YgiF